MIHHRSKQDNNNAITQLQTELQATTKESKHLPWVFTR